VDWRNKKVIAFDLGYTLVTNDRAKLHQRYLQSQGIDTDIRSIEMAYHVVDKEFMRIYPKVISTGWNQYFPWFVGRVNYELKHCFNLIEQTEFMSNEVVSNAETDLFWKPFPWTVEVLEQLKHKGYRIALLSNWDSSARSILAKLGLDSLFEVIVISDEVGCEKPEAIIFEELLRQLNCTAKEVLYVGDNYYDDVPGAQSVGMETIVLNPYNKAGMEELSYEPILSDIRSLLEYVPNRNEPARV
jgi:putative hydrolase of the HAD superfamily